MKKILNKLMIPISLFVIINLIGFWFNKNYEGAVAGSVIGIIIAFLILEIRANFD